MMSSWACRGWALLAQQPAPSISRRLSYAPLRFMQYEIIKAGLGHCCLSFTDDLAIHSRTAEEHIEHVAAVLDMLYGCGLRVHPEKSVFGAVVVSYLSHAVSESGLTPQEAKIKAVND